MNTSLPRLRWALVVLALVGLGVVAAYAVPGRFGLVPAANTSAATDATGQDAPTSTSTATPTATASATPSDGDKPSDNDDTTNKDDDTTDKDDTSDKDEDRGDAGPTIDAADDPKAPVGPKSGRSTNTVDSPPSDENVDYSLFGGDRHTIRFRNNTSMSVSVAVLMYDPDECGGEGKDWRSVGWFNFAPGQTKDVMRISNSYFAFYAVSDDSRHVWPRQSQSGNTRVYVSDLAFDSCQGYASTNSFAVNMKIMKASSGTYTVNLNASA